MKKGDLVLIPARVSMLGEGEVVVRVEYPWLVSQDHSYVVPLSETRTWLRGTLDLSEYRAEEGHYEHE